MSGPQQLESSKLEILWRVRQREIVLSSSLQPSLARLCILGSLPADIKALLAEHGALLCVQVHTHAFVCKMDDLQLDCELQTALAKTYVSATRCKLCFFHLQRNCNYSNKTVHVAGETELLNVVLCKP